MGESEPLMLLARGQSVAYETDLGKAWQGDALDALRTLPPRSVDLVFTSPPFPLVRQKAYGNVAADEWLGWFLPIAGQIRRVLRPAGNFVIELGSAWKPGTGTRSLYQYALALRLCGDPGDCGKFGERHVFHLAQEVYWHNPSRLPTPAEWVTRRRTHLRDAVSTFWWYACGPFPKADNRRVLTPYSASMCRLLKNGHRPQARPSGHTISRAVERDNGGAIPANLLSVPNTRSNDPYLRRCRAAGAVVHPARMPEQLPDFFIRLLTVPGQVVLDPFAGSNTTGYVAEQLGRRWLAIEIRRDYVQASRLRFEGV
jgi:site-specific DNA-methyltransferase (cytosine-N4-specific)